MHYVVLDSLAGVRVAFWGVDLLRGVERRGGYVGLKVIESIWNVKDIFVSLFESVWNTYIHIVPVAS